jgi:hypothetical protein
MDTRVILKARLVALDEPQGSVDSAVRFTKGI